MSDIDYDELAEKVVDHLTAKRRAEWIEPEAHAKHHEWVKRQMKDEEEWRQMRLKVIQSGLAWALPVALSFVAIAMWDYILDAVRK